MSDHPPPSGQVRRLSDVVRDVKIAAAERNDVVVEMRDAEHARLEILAKALEPVIADVPDDDDQFDFAVSEGLKPRFWIDAVAHVRMGRDRRTYSLVRDTRLGRTVVAEHADVARMADAVSMYVAERIIQRRRVLEGDWEQGLSRLASARDPAPQTAVVTEAPAASPGAMAVRAGPASVQAAPPASSTAIQKTTPRGPAFVAGLLWFIIGCVAGGTALLAAFWDRLGL